MFREDIDIDVDLDDPQKALKQFAKLTIDKHVANEDLLLLIMVENIGSASILKKSKVARERGQINLERLKTIVKWGQDLGVFRTDVDPEMIYAVIGGLSFNTMSNRHAIEALFGTRIAEEPGRSERRAMIADAALRYAMQYPEGS